MSKFVKKISKNKNRKKSIRDFSVSKVTKNKKNIGTSKFEKDLGDFIEKEFKIKLISQHKIGYKYYDFIIEGTKLLIEADGDYFHGNPEVFKSIELNEMQLTAKNNDLYKNALASSKGYKLLRIWENDFNNNKELVKKKVREFLLLNSNYLKG